MKSTLHSCSFKESKTVTRRDAHQETNHRVGHQDVLTQRVRLCVCYLGQKTHHTLCARLLPRNRALSPCLLASVSFEWFREYALPHPKVKTQEARAPPTHTHTHTAKQTMVQKVQPKYFLRQDTSPRVLRKRTREGKRLHTSCTPGVRREWSPESSLYTMANGSIYLNVWVTKKAV